MKEISADTDIKTLREVFDPSNPERSYSLNLAECYDQIILQSLLSIADKAASKSDGKFDIKACFYGVKINGKANWTPPTNKDLQGSFDLGDQITGNLVFQFTINPILFKVQ